jgi:endoglucanase
MKKTFRSIKALLASGLLLAGAVGNAQNYPFPQDTDYPFGYKPAGVTGAAAQTAYTSWKSGYLTAGPSCAPGTMRVKFDAVSGRFNISGDNSIATVSEGIGYGMLMTAYFGEKANFDGLWAYYKKHVNSNGIMNWGINNTSCTIIGQNGATDAELDVAWALYVASWQFDGGSQSSTYLAGAKALIAAIKKSEVDGSYTLKPGDQFGGSGTGNNDLVNPSYFSPAYYRVFGEITNDVAFWDAVYKKGYDILDLAMNKNTGLVPDWCTSTGTTPASGAAQYDDKGVSFFYDAIRTPVRTAMDYLWYGDQSPRALSYTTKINNWLRSKHPNPADIGSKYSLTGDKLQSFHNNTFVGAFAVSAMATSDANTRSYITSIYNENVKVNPGSGEYFNSSWKVLSLMMLSGNFYLPPPDLCEGPYVEPEYNLCSSTATPKSVTIDCYLTGANKYEWKKLGTTTVLGTAQKFTTTEAGIYEITTTVTVAGKPCIRRAATVVNPATPSASFTYTRSGLAVDFKNTSVGGDLIGGSLTSSWVFGDGSTPPTSTTTDGATNYSSGGSKLVTLTVKNTCNVTSSFTETIPLLQGSGPGWLATDFTTQNQGELSAYTAPNVPNTNVTITSNCQYGSAAVKKAMGRFETVAITLKSAGGVNAPIDVTAYPYVRFRIKIDAPAGVTGAQMFPNGLRVGLVNTDYVETGSVQANIVYLQGPRKPDGGYDPIPLNQWFVSTLSFEGKLGTIITSSKKVLQVAFTPYNDFPTATGRQDMTFNIDWLTVGNADITKPNPTVESGVQNVCITNPIYSFFGDALDSCNAEKVLWSDGVKTFSRTMIPGTYSVTVTNFAGSETRTFTVAAIDTIQPNLTYSIFAQSPFQIQPIDQSKGEISAYRWHKASSPSATLNLTYGATAANTMLYNVNSSTPAPSPTTAAKAFTGTGTEYLCLNATSRVANCTWHGLSSIAKKCIQVFPSGPLALEDKATESTFAIFPTVVTDNRLNVQLGTSLQGAFEVQVMNVNGKQVASSKAISGKNEVILDSNLPAGTYIVKVSQGDKTFTERFIKQ